MSGHKPWREIRRKSEMRFPWWRRHREEIIAAVVITGLVATLYVVALITQGRLLEFLMPRVW